MRTEERHDGSDFDSFKKLRIERARIHREVEAKEINEEDAKALLRMLDGIGKDLDRELTSQPTPSIRLVTTLGITIEDAVREVAERLQDEAFRDQVIELVSPYLGDRDQR